MSLTYKHILNKLGENEHLSESEARFALEAIINEEASSIEAGAFLLGMRSKGESIEELVTFVKVMREHAIKVDVDTDGAVDLCGTGGDQSGYFNISTAAMFVVAGADVPVLKHGNRSVSSKSGSADVLESLGAKVDLNKDEVEQIYEKTKMIFMFAPKFHPAMKNIVPVRRALKVRTFFNILGPLLNPADVKRQLVGAFDLKTAEIMANILSNLETKRALTVHARQGLDEFSVLTETDMFYVKDQSVAEKQVFDPKTLNMSSFTNDEELQGRDSKYNADLIQNILMNNASKIQTEIVAINAAHAILVSRDELDFETCYDMAISSIESGKAYTKLKQYVELTQKFN